MPGMALNAPLQTSGGANGFMCRDEAEDERTTHVQKYSAMSSLETTSERILRVSQERLKVLLLLLALISQKVNVR